MCFKKIGSGTIQWALNIKLGVLSPYLMICLSLSTRRPNLWKYLKFTFEVITNQL
jgi:hypothetical protein